MSTSNRLSRTAFNANMLSSRSVIDLALDALMAVRGGSEHDALNELLGAIAVSPLGPAGIGAVLMELVNDSTGHAR